MYMHITNQLSFTFFPENCMEYQGRKETTEQGITDLIAQYAESSFKPLDEPEFNFKT